MKCIIFIFCLILSGCEHYSNTITAPHPPAFENKDQHAQHTTINKEFAISLVNTALATDTEKEQHQFLLTTLSSLDKKQLDQLAALITTDRDRQAGEILPLDYIMPWRIAGWICNYIDDRLGRLQYDICLEGDIGLIDSGSTVRFYKFKPEIGSEIFVAIGMMTLEEYNNAIVSGHDWECAPNRVQLLLLRDPNSGPNYYTIVKITSLPQNSSSTSIWPQCR